MSRKRFPRTDGNPRAKRAYLAAPATWETSVAIALLCALALAFYRRIALTNLILSGADATTYFYPYRAYAAQAIRGGRIPLWNPYLFMGAPFLANPQTAVFYPLNLALCWLSGPKLVTWSIVIHVALAAIFAYLYARYALRSSPLPAFLGASVFAFGGFTSGQVEHVNQLNVSAWFPLLLLLWELRQRARWPALLGMGMTVGVGLLAGHTQSSYISLFGLAVYAVLSQIWAGTEGSPEGSPRRAMPLHSNARGHGSVRVYSALRGSAAQLLDVLWQLGLIALIGVGLAAIQLLPTFELARLSIRSAGLSYREAVAFSLKPLPRLLRYTFLPPWGHNLGDVYGGEFYTEYLAYLGVAPLLLAAWAVISQVRASKFGSTSRGAASVRAHFGSASGDSSVRREQSHAPSVERARQNGVKLLAIAGLGVFLALGLYNPLYFVLYKAVPGFDLFRVPARWLLLYAFGAAMLAAVGLQQVRDRAALAWFRLRNPAERRPTRDRAETAQTARSPSIPPAPHRRWVRRAVEALFVVIALAELFSAAQSLPLSHPTAPEVFSSLRTAPAHILSAQEAALKHGSAPGRFLSMSDIAFDPGDLPEIQQIFEGQLSPKAMYDYVVGIKRQEIIAPNLPLAWRIYAVDGYDGGVLPLARYVRLQELVLRLVAPAASVASAASDQILIDGRLREELKYIPPSRLLSILGVRYVITDKVHDVWIDDVFYDLAFDTILQDGSGEDRGTRPAPRSVSNTDLPPFEATALGIVSYLEGGAGAQDGTPVAEVRLTTEGGGIKRYILHAGAETAEGIYGQDVAHTQARVGRQWHADTAGAEATEGGATLPQPAHPLTGNDYVAVLRWGVPTRITRIEIVALPFGGRVHIRGTTLIDSRDGSNIPFILSTIGRFRQVHSGDVKVYEVLDALPRAYVVHETHVIADDGAAIAALGEPALFDPARMAILADGRALGVGATDPTGASQSQVTVTAYRPEVVVLQASLQTPGYLILSDSWYPGWKATIDGQPTNIERANVVFRAVYVPEGTHTVQFTYRPTSYSIGVAISLVTLAGLAIGLSTASRGSRSGRRSPPVPTHRTKTENEGWSLDA